MVLKVNQFYCVSCRKRVTLKDADICVKVYANRKTGATPALRGKCPCGTNVTKFIARDKADSLTKKFGKCKGKNASLSRKKSVVKSRAKKSGKKPCKSGKVRSRKTGRCRSPKNTVKKSTKKSRKPKKSGKKSRRCKFGVSKRKSANGRKKCLKSPRK